MMIASLRRSVARRGVSAAFGVLAALGLTLTGACWGKAIRPIATG
jgi:hypothetical protein